jgi:hypothetical protein
MGWVRRNGVWQKPDLYTVLDIPGEGPNAGTAIKDRTGKVITVLGGVQYSTAQSKLGNSSVFFDGNGDYLTVAYSDDFSFGTGNFTIDFWTRYAGFTLINHHVAQGNGIAGGVCYSGWVVYVYNNSLYLDRYIPETQTSRSVAWSPSLDTWYHVAIVRSENSLLFFINGTQQGATQDVTGVTYASINNLDGQMGLVRTGTGGTYYYLNGWMEAIRVSKGIARWTSGFTPPTRKYL